MTERICWNYKIKAFTVNGIACRGVHPTISKLFFPSYTYHTAIYGPHASPLRTGKLTRFKPGVHAGILLDNEMKRTVSLRAKYQLPVHIFTSNVKLHGYVHLHRMLFSPSDRLLMLKKSSIATMRVWQTFVKMQLTPMRSQVPVGNLTLRTATAVDVECTDLNNCIVLIELKLGFASYKDLHTSQNMLNIIPTTTDSPSNQHQLQLLLTTQLYKYSYTTARIGSAYIFRIDNSGVEVSPLQAWAKANTERVIQCVRQQR